MNRVIVVDDISANQMIIGKALKDNYSITMVNSGEQALDYLRKNPVDIVLLNVELPGMDGFETYEEIKKLTGKQDVPVVFLTQTMNEANEIRGLNMGATDFFRMPIVAQTLRKRIERILRLEELTQSYIADMQNEGDKDFLTGLLNRKSGERKIRKAMTEAPGCLIFIDLDNLKRTNDTMGHAAGDHAIKTVGDVLTEHAEKAVVSRIGGDEFVFYLMDADKDEAIQTMERIMSSFEKKKEGDVYLTASSISCGLCGTVITDDYSEVLKKADKALYRVKQSGKGGYYYYSDTADNSIQKASIDLKRLVNSIKQQGAYTGSMSLGYREFTKMYDYVKHLGERFGHDMRLIMITLEAKEEQEFDLADQEEAMACMEKCIQASLRSVDICARYSSRQFLLVLINAQRSEVSDIIERIFKRFHAAYTKKEVCLMYDVAEAEFIEK